MSFALPLLSSFPEDKAGSGVEAMEKEPGLDTSNASTAMVTAEMVTDGHPDKFCDQVADAILDGALRQDPKTRTGLGSLLTNNSRIVINGTGTFTIGGPKADAGVVGRKIVVDAYGPRIPVGGGAYSGKDPSKVDRSAAYMARATSPNRWSE